MLVPRGTTAAPPQPGTRLGAHPAASAGFWRAASVPVPRGTATSRGAASQRLASVPLGLDLGARGPTSTCFTWNGAPAPAPPGTRSAVPHAPPVRSGIRVFHVEPSSVESPLPGIARADLVWPRPGSTHTPRPELHPRAGSGAVGNRRCRKPVPTHGALPHPAPSSGHHRTGDHTGGHGCGTGAVNATVTSRGGGPASCDHEAGDRPAPARCPPGRAGWSQHCRVRLGPALHLRRRLPQRTSTPPAAVPRRADPRPRPVPADRPAARSRILRRRSHSGTPQDQVHQSREARPPPQLARSVRPLGSSARFVVAAQVPQPERALAAPPPATAPGGRALLAARADCRAEDPSGPSATERVVDGAPPRPQRSGPHDRSRPSAHAASGPRSTWNRPPDTLVAPRSCA